MAKDEVKGGLERPRKDQERPGPAECAMAAYFASRKQIRLLISAISALCLQHCLSPQGAGRIQPLRAFRRAKVSKLDLGTIENGSAASDLPPEGSKKKSWADLTHVAHFAKSKPRDYRKWIRDVRFTPRGSEKKALG